MTLEIRERIADPTAQQLARVQTTLTLPFELRQKSRLRAVLDSGETAALFLPRGMVLRHGDLLRASNGVLVQVRAAPEFLSMATTDDPLRLARACYHLGNRHVALQIGPDQVSYLHDHVLDEMVRGLGLAVTAGEAAFEPEAGAYGHGHQRHGHSLPDHDH